MNATIENVTIAHRHLAAAVRSALLAVPKNHHKRILRNVRVTCHDGGAVGVYATDLDTRVVVEIGDTDAEAIAKTLVPAHVAAAIAKVKDVAAFAVHDGGIEAFGATMPTDDVSEFPRLNPSLDCPSAATVHMRMIRLIAEHVATAADEESSRYSLGGVLLERRPSVDPYTLHAVGTDGRRLHVASCRDDRSGGGELGAIVPVAAFEAFRRAVGFVAASLAGKGGRAAETMADTAYATIRVLPDDAERRAVGDYGAATAELRWAHCGVCVTVTTRTFDGRYPRWRDCCPIGATTMPPVYCPMPETAQQVKDAARVTTEQDKGVRLAGGRLSARGHDGASFDAPFVGTGAETAAALLDPRFWLAAIEGVAAVTSVPVPMHVIDAGKSAITFVGNGGLTPDVGEIGFTAIVMPIGQ